MRDDRPEALSARPDAVEVPAAEVPAPDIPATADWPRRNDFRSPAELHRRLDSLPDGHPSSRYEADGSLRDSPVRLSDLETPPPEDEASSDADLELAESGQEAASPDNANQPADIRPYTDAEWADHITEVRTRLDKAFDAGLATDSQYTIDPRGEIWSDERATLHSAIIEDSIAKACDVPREHKAIIAGGLGGAGKSTVLDQYAEFDRSQYLTINPDSIKEEMASQGVVPYVEGLSPMEASALAHEEASHIAKQLAMRARSEGINIVWDITMSSTEKTKQRIDELRESRYERIDGLFVGIPIAVSVARADSRHRSDHEKYRAGEGFGGRLVSEDLIRAQADEQWGSQNRRTFEDVKHRFDTWSRYDNAVDGRRPLLVEMSMPQDSKREEGSQ